MGSLLERIIKPKRKKLRVIKTQKFHVTYDRYVYDVSQDHINKKGPSDMDKFATESVRHLLSILDFKEKTNWDRNFRFYVPLKSGNKSFNNNVNVYESQVTKIQRYVDEGHFSSVEDFIENALIEYCGSRKAIERYAHTGMAMPLCEPRPDLNKSEKNVLRKYMGVPPIELAVD